MDMSGARLDGAVHLFAAGSLKAALSELAQAFEARVGIRVATVFAPSGLLKARLLQSGESGLFASANMAHPRALADAGRATTVHPFARNQLCAIAQPEVEVSEDTLLNRLLDPGIRLGTSTPQADPAGDYVWDVFRKAEALRPGSFAALEAPALRIVALPAAMAVGADYGLAVLNGTDRARAEAFAQSILSPAGQAILQGYGFAGP